MKKSELKKKSKLDKFTVVAFYTFQNLDDSILAVLEQEVSKTCRDIDVKGMILIANEGINGTICGVNDCVEKIIAQIKSLLSDPTLHLKFSFCPKQAFRKFRMRRKAEIVTMGVEDLNPSSVTGSYVKPCDWNKYLDDPNTVVIDTRNDYEIAVGGFEGSLNPNTEVFSQFPEWVDKVLRPMIKTNKIERIAMFCTGGIRCEKASSYLKKEGFDNVNQLHGGILQYLKDVPNDESRWKGECFVFDRRVSLNHQLEPGTYTLCNACGMPLSVDDLKKNEYSRGISCHNCIERFTDKDRLRFAERQKHIDWLKKNKPNDNHWPCP